MHHDEEEKEEQQKNKQIIQPPKHSQLLKYYLRVSTLMRRPLFICEPSSNLKDHGQCKRRFGIYPEMCPNTEFEAHQLTSLPFGLFFCFAVCIVFCDGHQLTSLLGTHGFFVLAALNFSFMISCFFAELQFKNWETARFHL